jgi:CubicO group peptidase (beta-lactamase class C family)
MSHLSRFVTVWSVLQAQVDRGRLPGYVAAVRFRGETEVRAGGCLALRRDEPLRPGTPFRIASLSKLFAGALTLALAEDGVLHLDDPVGRWLPELASPRVLAHSAARLDETVPAARPITVWHLLTSTPGFGGVWEPGPLQQAIDERGIGPSPVPPAMAPDEFLRRLGELPLAGQPGEVWLYHIATEVLSVLLSRAAGRPLHALLEERLAAPLGLTSTGFWTADDPLPTCYEEVDGRLRPWPMPATAFTRPPVFEGLAGGLVSTAPDLLAFLGELADGGGTVLSPDSVGLMTRDALTAPQRTSAAAFLGAGRSWGLQVAVDLEPMVPGAAAGRWGWDGGTGTSAWVDPERELVALLLTQRMTTGPTDGPAEFWRAVYRCL